MQFIRSFFLASYLVLVVTCWSLAADDVNAPPPSTPFAVQLEAGLFEPSLQVANDLRCDLILQEPTVANPLHLSFDERGRLWVVQYRQYPWPAGLKLLSRDNVWRNVYSPPFAPPPPHAADSPFRGKDQITIHEDTNRDGRFDSHRVFLDGLNFATAALPGRGGVYVLNPPYLLFYPDRNRDDQPDTLQPEMLLSGFGIEDSHSIANSLRWGPDGWIYATQGSTVSGSIISYDAQGNAINPSQPVHSLGQNVWRYHPETRRYEVFAEGGGNAFGVEIDTEGRIYSGHNGGDTRGFYYVQGGYSQKNFGKHGELSNPYAFAFYPPMTHHPVVRFTHTFCINEANGLPSRYGGLLFGVNPVEHEIILSTIGADGSSRKTRDLAVVVKPADTPQANWFTPVDIQLGPDGALYVADWYSVQPNHYRNHEGQTNPDLGRVYRLRGTLYSPAPRVDMAALGSSELIDKYLDHPNRWYRQTALRVLADRKDASVIPRLKEELADKRGLTALNRLWALNVSGGWSDEVAEQALAHSEAAVRRWAVRLIGDDRECSPRLSEQLISMAALEPEVETRLQLAATARRIDARTALTVVAVMANCSSDASDPYLPNMLWWALEAHANDVDTVVSHLQTPGMWSSQFRIAGVSLIENLMQRYAMSGKQVDLDACAKLLDAAPSIDDRQRLIAAFSRAYAGRPLPPLPTKLADLLARDGGPFALLLGVRQQRAADLAQALSRVSQADTPLEERIELIRALSDVRALPEQTVALFLGFLEKQEPEAIQLAALNGLQKYQDAAIPEQVVHHYSQGKALVQAASRQLLASRADWAVQLLNAIESGIIAADDLESDTIDRLRRYSQPEIAGPLNQRFPMPVVDAAQLDQRIATIERVILQGDGDPLKGKQLFAGNATCSKCHRLFTQGSDLGPDLTSFNRSDLRRMLLAVVNPSAEIREGFGSVTVMTADGRVLSGLKIDQNDNVLVVRGTDGQDQVIAATEIDELVPNPQSLMPVGLLDRLTDDEIRDLFAYLTSTTPPL